MILYTTFEGVGVITAMEILQEFGGGSMQSLVNLKYVSII